MLRTNIKHLQTRVSIEVTNYDEYTDFEEGVFRSVAENRYSEIAESIRLLCKIEPEFDKIQLVEKYEACSEYYIERALDSGLGQIEIFEGYEVTYFGEPWEVALFNAAAEKGCSIAEWYLEVEELGFEEKAKLHWLIVECGYNYEHSMSELPDTVVYSTTLRAAAEEIFDDLYLYQIPENLQSYVNYDSFAYDLRAGSDLCEFQFAGQTWTAENR